MAKIMFADDAPETVFVVKLMLERAGHEVVVAYNGDECLEKLKDVKPDLILLDIMMPGKDGWEVCRTIKESGETRDIPVVIFTVLFDEESVKKSRECGADAHISKPFEWADLLDTIERVLTKEASP